VARSCPDRVAEPAAVLARRGSDPIRGHSGCPVTPHGHPPRPHVRRADRPASQRARCRDRAVDRSEVRADRGQETRARRLTCPLEITTTYTLKHTGWGVSDSSPRRGSMARIAAHRPTQPVPELSPSHGSLRFTINLTRVPKFEVAGVEHRAGAATDANLTLEALPCRVKVCAALT